MCGIAGLWLRGRDERAEKRVADMVACQAHRGPDDRGVQRVGSEQDEIWLGHARLSILDLSSAARQPMHDRETGNWIVFNGEIYNHLDIRKELDEGPSPWISHSDTETILRAYAKWGTECLAHMRGMFAFGLYDAKRRTLWCARDRMGVKPFYFTQTSRGFVFASEVRAILNSGFVERVLDPGGLASYVRYGSVSEPHAIIAGIQSLPAATWIEVNDRGISRTEQYWQLSQAPVADDGHRPHHEIRKELERSVREHLLADVPVAAFLSGGIDSSVVTALAAKQSSRKLRTFTVGFAESSLDERAFAAEVARHYDTEHHEVLITSAETAALVPSGVAAMDQPSADALNTYIVSHAVRGTGTKVALSGLGSDELFGGYRSFRILPLARDWGKRIGWLSHSSALARFAPGGARGLEVFRKHSSLAMRYETLRSYWSREELRVMRLHAPSIEESTHHSQDIGKRISLLELDHYMRNVLLRDSDSMSMARSLELRVPFLDHQVVAAALRHGVAGRGDKPLLVQAIKDLLPQRNLRRKKQGFVLPMAEWMRGPLADHVKEGLSHVRKAGVLRHVPLDEISYRFDRQGLHWSRLWQFVVLGHWIHSVIGSNVEIADTAAVVPASEGTNA